MRSTCGINFAPLVLGENGNDDCIALAGYVINQRTLGAFWRSFSEVNSAKNTKSLTLSLVNDKHTSGALNNTTSSGRSAKGAESLTLGESQGKSEQKPLSTKGAKSRTLSKTQKKDRMLNFAPVVLGEIGDDDCIALSGYVINQRTLGAFWRSFSRANSAKNTKSLTLSIVNDKPSFGTLNNTISAASSAKGAKSLTLGESQGKSEQKPLSTKGAKSLIVRIAHGIHGTDKKNDKVA